MTDLFEPTTDDWETYKRLESAPVEEIAQNMKSLLERLQHVAAEGGREAQLIVFRDIKYTLFCLAVAEARESRTGEAVPAPSPDDITFLHSEGISASTESPAEDIKKAYWQVAVSHLPHIGEGYERQESYDSAVARLAEL